MSSALSRQLQYKVFFDVKTLDEPVGRMVFTIEQGNLQRSVENFKTLVAGSRRSLDPMLSYLGCEFAFGPQYVLQVRPSTRVVAMVHGGYRWGVGDVGDLFVLCARPDV